eukprot:scaffold43028_cov49-Cyclotella_meneghiniana.AAC.1
MSCRRDMSATCPRHMQLSSSATMARDAVGVAGALAASLTLSSLALSSVLAATSDVLWES